MGRDDSPLAGKLIFNVGARRSGTYWLQRIVTAHPEVADVPGESHFFSHGIAPLMERFHHGARGSVPLGKLYAEREELVDAVRDLCDRVLADFLEPGHTRLAERTPVHVYHLGLISELYPDAQFVHIIRDGRDVARSLAARSWGPDTLGEAAEEWRSSIVSAREQRPADGYMEVRYEELLADPEAGIRAIYAQLGLEATPRAMELALAAARDSSLNVDPNDTRITTRKWESSLSRSELREVEEVAGDLLSELGYAGGSPRRRTLPRLPRRPRRAPSAEPAPKAGPPESLFEELLGRVHRGEPERAVELLHPDATVRIVSPEGQYEDRGAPARERLLSALREDPAFAGRQIRGDVYHSRPTTGGLISYELPDGSRADRLLFTTERDGRIGAVGVYRLGGD